MLSHSKFFAQRTREILVVNMNVIAGLSASGAPALTIAEAYFDKYIAIASRSGYTAVLHVDKLKNTKVYFYSGSAWKRRLRHRPTRHVLERRYGVPRTPHQRAFRRPGTWRGCRRHL
ncbi:hypothetical protein HMPREF3227_00176 [Corynebacterium sp. CMW7794]|nr:hypothetical protein HMPREF3227_00176 [Corynebacterium sp. CMW7794]